MRSGESWCQELDGMSSTVLTCCYPVKLPLRCIMGRVSDSGPHLCSCAATWTESMISRRASEICLALTVCCSNLVFTADWEIHSCRHTNEKDQRQIIVSLLDMLIWCIQVCNSDVACWYFGFQYLQLILPQSASRSSGTQTFWPGNLRLEPHLNGEEQVSQTVCFVCTCVLCT